MSRRVVFFFVIMLVVVVAIILSVTLFTVRKIDVVYETESSIIDSAKIVECSQIEIGSNIFSLREKIVSSNIEKSNPYIDVKSIVRRFPNKVVINVDVRSPLLQMSLQQSQKVAVLDQNLSIICLVEPDNYYASKATKIIGYSIDGDGSELEGESLSLNDQTTNDIYTIINAYLSLLHNSDSAFTTFIEEITVSNEYSCISLKTNKGLQILLRTNLSKESSSLEQQAISSYTVYNEILRTNAFDITTGYLCLNVNDTVGWSYSEDFPLSLR